MGKIPERIGLFEGKTKIVLKTAWTGHVLIESKDAITASDGAKRDSFDSKGVLATSTTRDCFKLLRRKGIPNHYLYQFDGRTFMALELQMIPIKLMAWRIAFDSYRKRHPRVKEGTRFERLRLEMFLKDDARHDPLMDWQYGHFELYDPKKPKTEGFMGTLPDKDVLPLVPSTYAEVKKLLRLLSKTFRVLEEAWSGQGVTLVDLEIECGYTPDGRLVVGDVIGNDSWHIWPGGDKSQMKGKQKHRDAKDAAAMDDLKKNYEWVAEATSRF